MEYTYLLKKVGKIFGIVIYFLYLCNVIYSCSLFENINSYNNSFKIVILIIRLNCPFVRNRQFQEVTSELPLFLFMYCIVGLAIRLFICARSHYLLLCGIVVHSTYFNVLESKIYNKREVPLSVHPFQYIITIGQQNTLTVSISGHLH